MPTKKKRPTPEHNPEPVPPKWNANDPMGSFHHYAESLHQKAKWMFLKDGTHVELMFIFKSSGECFLLLVKGDRDQFVIHLRDLIKRYAVIGIVHIAEAWMRIGGHGDHITTQLIYGEMAVSDLLPADRSEALLVGIHSNDGQVVTWVEPIIRDANGKPTLGKAFNLTDMAGRYGMLFK